MNVALFVLAGYTVTPTHLLIAAGFLLLGLIIGASFKKQAPRPVKPAPAQTRRERKASESAFLKGITHLMADHTDEAIEEFTRSVKLNTETVETYVVLGNLFRQKGEIDRAVRIRQNIIARPRLNPEIRMRALYDLGLDYRKGGLYNRAVEIFAEVIQKDPKHKEALAQLVTLYEEMRDWDHAFDARKRLDKLAGESSRMVLAHYRAERGKELMAQGSNGQAEEAFNQALGSDKGCIDAYLHLGDLELAKGRAKKAVNVWKKAASLAPQYAHLVVKRMSDAEEELSEDVVEGFMSGMKREKANYLTLAALASYYHLHRQDDTAVELLELAVEKAPGHLGAHRMRGEILMASGDPDAIAEAYRDLLNQINGQDATYHCGQCGYKSRSLVWKCPRCQRWDTVVPND